MIFLVALQKISAKSLMSSVKKLKNITYATSFSKHRIIIKIY